ncbi:cation diffusion facilitator family transporter [bacterium]|nr:cation diffusion facilitator family transporter [bacterium]
MSEETTLTPRETTVATARKTVTFAVITTIALAALKVTIGAVTGSSALLADALHSTTDVIALSASWFGLWLAGKKPTERFPYGFYRAETLAALAASGVILLLGISILIQGIQKLKAPAPLHHSWIALGTALVSAVIAFWVSTRLKRVARQTNSQSLDATGDEARMDCYTSLLVFVGVFAASIGFLRADAIVAILFSVLVLWIGGRNSWIALLSLMDASVDKQLEADVADILMQIAGIKNTHKLRARRAGPFYFIEGHIHVPSSMDVASSHALAHEAERVVRQKRPEVEGVILHVEPYREVE